LIIAVKQGDLPLVKLLLEKGADVNGRGDSGYTPLIASAFSRQTDIARYLLECGARPNLHNSVGQTAFGFAVNRQSTEFSLLLLKHGANINGGRGEPPPIMDAACNGWADGVRLLIAKGANVNRKWQGHTALEAALINRERDVAAVLRMAGGKSRPEGELRQEAERVARELAAESRRRPAWGIRDRALSREDQHVIETVLLDLLAYQEREVLLGNRSSRDIVLVDMTPQAPGLLLDSQMNSELGVKQANDVSLAIRKHLARRNGDPLSLAEFRPTSPHILLRSQPQIRAMFDGFIAGGSAARGWVQVYLPGYSKARDRAVLRFWFGPAAHGAAGTYFLRKQKGVWQPVWRSFSFFA
jgi:ankyrin repeat protein